MGAIKFEWRFLLALQLNVFGNESLNAPLPRSFSHEGGETSVTRKKRSVLRDRVPDFIAYGLLWAEK